MKTKAVQVLDFIREAGSTGRRFTEIQRFVAETLNCLDFDERTSYKNWKGKVETRRRYRGYWCDALLETCSAYGHRLGLLKKHCIKNAEGRWVCK